MSDVSVSAPSAEPAVRPGKAWFYLGALAIGYIGVYLCRKNLSVALPMIQEEFKVSKEEVGKIASYSTLAYAIGKILLCPLADRFGGRNCFLFSLLMVAIFGALGGLAPGLGALALIYSCNRFFGAAGWGAMVKQVPDWFSPKKLALAIAILSLSFVFGGVIASNLAGKIAALSQDNWRIIMSAPAVILVGILVFCWFVLPKGDKSALVTDGKSGSKFSFSQLAEIIPVRQFWIVCALSGTLTLVRETFNVWTVDFIKTEGGPQVSTQVAAFLSSSFDFLGAAGIIALGWILGRLSGRQRSWLLFGILGALTCVLGALPFLLKFGLGWVTLAIGLVGFLVYGPYSLLAGVFAVEIKGKKYAATICGIVDAVGYLAGYLSGSYFGKILDWGGYKLGFQSLAALTFVSALMCLMLYPRGSKTAEEGQQI